MSILVLGIILFLITTLKLLNVLEEI